MALTAEQWKTIRAIALVALTGLAGVFLGETTEPLARISVVDSDSNITQGVVAEDAEVGEALVVSRFTVETGGDIEVTWTPNDAPTPDPNTPPDVVDPPVVVESGQRIIALLRETGGRGEDIGGLIVDLRNGPDADYIASKGHRFLVNDPGDQDENGNTPPIVAKLQDARGELALPVLAIIDADTGQVLSIGKVPATSEGVLQLLKRNGG